MKEGVKIKASQGPEFNFSMKQTIDRHLSKMRDNFSANWPNMLSVKCMPAELEKVPVVYFGSSLDGLLLPWSTGSLGSLEFAKNRSC